MKLCYFQHVPFEGLGCIEDWAKFENHVLSFTRFFQNDPLPQLGEIDWLIVMGGPMGALDEGKYSWLVAEKRFIERAIIAGKVVIGICLGAQLIADVLGAEVYPNPFKEIGWFPIQLTPAAQRSELFDFMSGQQEVFHWHGDTFDLPDGAVHIARSDACRNQAFVYKDKVIGLQFHLELTSENVRNLIENCSADLVEGAFIQSPSEMLLHKEAFEETNRTMDKLLTRIHTRNG
jgi:GMP synthase-like glutamine amidotransferase